jgi:hypothetical protein
MDLSTYCHTMGVPRYILPNTLHASTLSGSSNMRSTTSQDSRPPREVRYYSPLEDHHDGYFVLLNREDTVLALTFGFPFGPLRDYVASSISNDTTQVER